MVERCNPEHLTAVLAKLDEVGVQVVREAGKGVERRPYAHRQGGKQAARP